MEGYKARIMRSPEVKAHFERALEINALDDPTTWHLLGKQFKAIIFPGPQKK